MRLFGNKNNKTDLVTKINVFPTINSVVLKKDNKLIIFSPQYLLGKHGSTTKEVASKFMNLNTAKQLLELIDNHISSKILTGSKVEVKEINFKEPVGYDSLVKISEDLVNVLPRENIREHNINVIYCARGKIPKTNFLNVILVPFNPAYGQNIDKLFKQKYGDVGFEDFDSAYAILTIYPGKFAPPMSDSTFWNYHALLKEL